MIYIDIVFLYFSHQQHPHSLDVNVNVLGAQAVYTQAHPSTFTTNTFRPGITDSRAGYNNYNKLKSKEPNTMSRQLQSPSRYEYFSPGTPGWLSRGRRL